MKPRVSPQTASPSLVSGPTQTGSRRRGLQRFQSQAQASFLLSDSSDSPRGAERELGRSIPRTMLVSSTGRTGCESNGHCEPARPPASRRRIGGPHGRDVFASLCFCHWPRESSGAIATAMRGRGLNPSSAVQPHSELTSTTRSNPAGIYPTTLLKVSLNATFP